MAAAVAEDLRTGVGSCCVWPRKLAAENGHFVSPTAPCRAAFRGGIHEDARQVRIILGGQHPRARPAPDHTPAGTPPPTNPPLCSVLSACLCSFPIPLATARPVPLATAPSSSQACEQCNSLFEKKIPSFVQSGQQTAMREIHLVMRRSNGRKHAAPLAAAAEWWGGRGNTA